MEYIFLWVVFCFIVGAIGSNRNIGFFASFMISLILSPLIGLIFALISKSKTAVVQEKTLSELQQQAAIPHKSSVADELLKLKSLLDQGVISDDEYNQQKAKVLAR